MFQDRRAIKYPAKLVNKSTKKFVNKQQSKFATKSQDKNAERNQSKNVKRYHENNVHQSTNVKFANNLNTVDETNKEIIYKPIFKSIHVMIFIFCLELNIK